MSVITFKLSLFKLFDLGGGNWKHIVLNAGKKER